MNIYMYIYDNWDNVTFNYFELILGFVENGLLASELKTTNEYHEEINAATFNLLVPLKV